MASVVLSPQPLLLLQQQQARVEALEIQRHYHHHATCPSTLAAAGQEQEQHVLVDKQMRRARAAVEAAGLYSSVWTWVPPDYYTAWSLQARADYLNVPHGNVDYLCKSLLLENKMVVQNDNDDSPMDRTNPKYILVLLQYAATLDVKKLITAIRAMRANVHERLDEHRDFDVRVASSDDNAVLTGYEHNSVTPFGLLQPDKILIVLSKEVVALRRFWMGGGHVNLKLSMAVSDFVSKKSGLNPLIADISNPRTGLELNLTTPLVDVSSMGGHAESSSNGGGGGGAAPPSASSGGKGGTPADQQQLLDAKINAAAALAAAATSETTIIKKTKHKDKKKHRSSSKKDKNNNSNPDGSSPSSSCASQTSEESKEKKVGAGYIVHVQFDDKDMDDQSAITTPVMKVKSKHSSCKKDKDKKKKKKTHRSKTILEEEGVEESTTTSSSHRSHSKSKEDRSASEEPTSSSAAESSSPKSSGSRPDASSSDGEPARMVPTLPDKNNHHDDEDSPGKMHRFQLLVDDAAPALPVAAAALPAHAQQKPKPRVIPSRAMSSDLQAIMKRRREMAETLSSDNVPTAALMDTTSTKKSQHYDDCRVGSGDDDGSRDLIRNKSPDRRLKTVGMSSDLQAIMARRRRLAEGDADDAGR